MDKNIYIKQIDWKVIGRKWKETEKKENEWKTWNIIGYARSSTEFIEICEWYDIKNLNTKFLFVLKWRKKKKKKENLK